MVPLEYAYKEEKMPKLHLLYFVQIIDSSNENRPNWRFLISCVNDFFPFGKVLDSLFVCKRMDYVAMWTGIKF